MPGRILLSTIAIVSAVSLLRAQDCDPAIVVSTTEITDFAIHGGSVFWTRAPNELCTPGNGGPIVFHKAICSPNAPSAVYPYTDCVRARRMINVGDTGFYLANEGLFRFSLYPRLFANNPEFVTSPDVGTDLPRLATDGQYLYWMTAHEIGRVYAFSTAAHLLKFPTGDGFLCMNAVGAPRVGWVAWGIRGQIGVSDFPDDQIGPRFARPPLRAAIAAQPFVDLGPYELSVTAPDSPYSMRVVAGDGPACGSGASVYVAIDSPEPVTALSLGIEWDAQELEFVELVPGPDIAPARVLALPVNPTELGEGRAIAGLLMRTGDAIDASAGSARALEIRFRRAGGPTSTVEQHEICIREGIGSPPVQVILSARLADGTVVSRPAAFGCRALRLAPDTTAPEIECPADIVMTGASDGAVVAWEPLATDDCGPVSLTCEPPSGSLFPIGMTEVICAARDEAGNVSECSFRVTVEPAGFRRADSNADGEANISDPANTLGFLFLGSAPPACFDAVDADDSGQLDISDAIMTLNFLFLGGPHPTAPGPFGCGPDPTADDLPDCEYDEC